MLKVYKASAGSGKTFQLVAEYLKLLVKNQQNYRNILAVTFTNKATSEMKSRILEQLYQLANHEESAYLGLLTSETGLPEETIRQRAKQVLKNILHDYNRFSVNTIDSFTQRVIKAFNREMGISPHFMLELDNEMILEEAVDRLMAKVDTDKKLRRWLVKFSEEKIRENKSQRIEEDIKNLGNELFKEKFQVFFPENEIDGNPYTRKKLEEFRTELGKIIAWYRQNLKNKAAKCMDVIQQSGFTVDDFSYKMSGVAGYLKKTAEGEIKEPGARVLAAADSAEKWISKTHQHKMALEKLVENELHPLLLDFLGFFSGSEERYQSALAVQKQLRMLGILTDLKEEVKLLLQEKGLLQLSDSNLLLSRIIGQSDSPFIYEKIGTRFNYYMLDEFQDTSSLQWNNFKPLIANALSEGYPALLVGDVKQSIYRWRNSDWNILAGQINADFPNFPPGEIPLTKNWRSELNVIEFNNAAIGALKKTFEDFLFEDFEDERFEEKFSSIYQNFRQEPGRANRERKGLTEVCFLPEDDFEELSCSMLVEQVKKLQDNGLNASEIAILIRKNSEGPKIVEAFMNASEQDENRGYNLSVLSNESLFLYTSRGVNLVLLVVELLIDADAKIQQVALLHLWLSWVKPELKKQGYTFSDSPQLTLNFNDTQQNAQNGWSVDEHFEVVFESELGKTMEQLRQKVLLTSLDETVTAICDQFGLFGLESELPYLQCLIDQAADLKISLSNDLSNFLFWWNEKGHKTSVNINEDVDSVRLLTVHKAKGLEYEAVLLPFFNWDVSWVGNQTPMLWCRPGSEPFNRFPLLPVKAGSELKKTIFSDDYFEEKVSSYIDTLNLVYVAFTRAKSVLVVHCRKKEETEQKKKSDVPGKTVNALLEFALKQISAEKQFHGCWNNEETVFSYGEMPVFRPKESNGQSGWIKNYRFYNFSNRLKLRLTSEDFLLNEAQKQSVRNTGKMVHEILADVETEKEFEKACDKALKEGRINAAGRETILEKMRSSLRNPQIKSWFDGSFNVLNERNLLSPGSLLRPDRIMIAGTRAVVVDYKWGEKMSEKYHRQVMRYAETLKKCGFEKVEGFLWYINQDEVEQVV